jgi:hypothetical protein
VLANVLLTYALRYVAIGVGAVALVLTFVMGPNAGLGVMVGGGIIVLSGGGLVLIVGRLLDPTVSSTTKGVFTLVLVGKLTIVAGLLWACLSIWAIDQLGLLIGMGVGLGALVLGLNRGSTSEAGQAAIRAAEERIAQEMGDDEDEMG